MSSEDYVLLEEVKNRVSFEQRQLMLAFMKEHPILAAGRPQGPGIPDSKQRQLENLATKLNACITGPKKSSDKWLKSWQDWKTDVKLKDSKLRRLQRRPSEGPPARALTPLQEELLLFIRELLVMYGNTEVPDSLECNEEHKVADDVQALIPTPLTGSLDTEPVTLERTFSSDNQTPTTPQRSQVELTAPPTATTFSKTRRLGPSVRDERLLSSAGTQKEALRIYAEAKQRQAAAAERMAAAQEKQSKLLREQIVVQERQVAAYERQAAASERQAAACEMQASAILAISNAFTDAVQSFQEYLDKVSDR